MKDIVNEYMKNNRATDWSGVKHLHCNDGFSMSVQAHKYNYCSPRVNPEETDWYDQVEVGFPSEREELLMEYVEDYDKPTAPSDAEVIQYCIDLIKEYLQQETQVLAVGAKVKVLVGNLPDSGEFYDEGEKGIISRMLYDEDSCVVHFGFRYVEHCKDSF